MKIQIANIKGIKFLLLLVVFLIVIMLPTGATFIRRMLYVLAGIIFMAKVRSKKWY